MSWFSDQIASELAVHRQHAGEPAVYRRNGVDINVTAQPTQPERPANEERRMVVQSDSVDFLIGRSELTHNGTEFEPTIDHTITVTIGAVSLTYGVVELDGEQCWRWSDTGHSQYRIHAKLVRK